MNANVVVVAFLLVVLSLASALPVSDDLKHQLSIKVMEEAPELEAATLDNSEEPEDDAEDDVGRFRRATCDLLSFNTKFGSLNHSACAAHCLAKRKGYRGGRCKNGVCHCRRVSNLYACDAQMKYALGMCSRGCIDK